MDAVLYISLVFSGFILGVVSMVGLDAPSKKRKPSTDHKTYAHLRNRGHLNIDDFEKLTIAYQLKYDDHSKENSVDDKI